MSDPQIICPNCSTLIKLTDRIAAPIIANACKVLEQQLAQKEALFVKRETGLLKAQQALKKARKSTDKDVAKKLQAERALIAKKEAGKAHRLMLKELHARDRQLATLRRSLKASTAQLTVARRAQADLLRKSRKLDDAKRKLDLSVEKKVQRSLAAACSQAKADAEHSFRSQVTEKQLQIAGMRRQIEELRRRVDQGSEQLHGETLEVELEALLRQRFPHDLIQPVPKGASGADILHRVHMQNGQLCGTILWECKRTKVWSDRWLAKLRHDQRSVNAELALIVSTTLPKGRETFDIIENVWVAAPRFAIPLAAVLRQCLIDLATARGAVHDQRNKTELLFKYLTGPRFRQRIEAIIEKFIDMQNDLNHERKVTMRIWAKRDEQLKEVLDSSASLYGDLQGVAGRSMPQIKSLDHLIAKEPMQPILNLGAGKSEK